MKTLYTEHETLYDINETKTFIGRKTHYHFFEEADFYLLKIALKELGLDKYLCVYKDEETDEVVFEILTEEKEELGRVITGMDSRGHFTTKAKGE